MAVLNKEAGVIVNKLCGTALSYIAKPITMTSDCNLVLFHFETTNDKELQICTTFKN